MRYKSIHELPVGMRQQASEKLAAQGAHRRGGKPSRSKYGNVRTTTSGEVFASKAEARDDQILRMREAAGEIAGYARQVSIPLRARRKRIQLDWLVNEPRPHACTACGHVDHIHQLILKDTKTEGTLTREWETKRRVVEAQLGVQIELISH